MTEEKTKLPSHRNQDWKKVKIEIKKVNKLFTNSPTESITELNELIYTEVKLVCGKINVPFNNSNRNTKLGWEIRLEWQVKKLWQ